MVHLIETEQVAEPKSVVLGFTWVKNINYALAENRATSATASLGDGRLEMAIQSTGGAIALASDIGKNHVIPSNILTRSSTSGASDQAGLPWMFPVRTAVL